MANKRRGRAGWQRLISKYERGELTQAEFASQHGVSVSALQHWLYLFRREGCSVAAEAVGFVEVQAGAVLHRTPRVELELPSGIVVRLGDNVDGEKIAEVVRHLQDLVRC